MEIRITVDLSLGHLIPPDRKVVEIKTGSTIRWETVQDKKSKQTKIPIPCLIDGVRAKLAVALILLHVQTKYMTAKSKYQARARNH